MVALATLGTISTVVIAWQISKIVTTVFVERNSIESIYDQIILISIFGIVKAIGIWGQELISSRAAVAVKMELRNKLFTSVAKLGSNWLNKNSIAEVNLLATTGLDSLEPYFAKYLPQLVYTALVTPALLVLVWSQDFVSGVVLIFTLPLIPLFMILIGWATNSVQQKQLDALTTLSQHFLEVLRGLPTLRIFNRANAQVSTIENVSNQYRVRTMKVLRITFLSGFALELLSSLSVALIAVSIGLRLVSGDITLFVGLFVLLLAPEVYLPIRQVGVHFHAAAEGVTSSQKVLNIIDLAREQDFKTHEELVKDSAELDDFSTDKLNVIVGQSGSGKTTIFRNLLGLDGAPAKLQFEEVAWLPQQISLFSGSVLENIIGADELDNHALNSALKLACLDDLPLNYKLGDDASQVSGGQAQRIGLARCFYRVITKQTQYLMLDEPISALDQPRAISVVASLKQFVLEGKTVIAITHQGLLIDAADRVIEVGNA